MKRIRHRDQGYALESSSCHLKPSSGAARFTSPHPAARKFLFIISKIYYEHIKQNNANLLGIKKRNQFKSFVICRGIWSVCIT